MITTNTLSSMPASTAAPLHGRHHTGLTRPGRLGGVFLGGLLGISVAVPATAAMFETDNFQIYGDFRARLENDWDSQKTDGTDRDDRLRARIRARVGMKYKPNDNFTFDTRLRTGSDDSHQSPHITVADFSGNDTGDSDVNFDKWYLKGETDSLWGWIGRNSFPFWKQNELFWDDDATPAGIAAGYKHGIGSDSKLALNTGYLSLPSGMQEFCGDMGAAQVVFSTKVNDTGLTAAGGFFSFDGDSLRSNGQPSDSDCQVDLDGDGNTRDDLLLDGNGLRDYEIWVVNLQAKLRAMGMPLTLGVDYMHNAEDYSATDSDPLTAAHKDETDGYVISAKLGQLKEPSDWLGAVYYANIETFAVNSSYAQDDWVRWGSAVESRGSNMEGFELRAGYVPARKMNILARLYIVDQIEKRPGATHEEDGNRFRVDFNYKF